MRSLWRANDGCQKAELALIDFAGFYYLFIYCFNFLVCFVYLVLFCFGLVWFGLVGLLWLFVWLLQQFTTVSLRFHGFFVLSFFSLFPPKRRGVLVRSSSPCVMWGPFLPKVSPFFLPFLFGTSNCPYHFLRVFNNGM